MLTGFDWSGKPRATVRLHCAPADSVATHFVTQAPRGNGFLLDVCTFDRLGRVISTSMAGKGYSEAWSEDGSLLCGVDESTDENKNTADFYLTRRLPNGAAQRVGRFLHVDGIPGDMGYNPLSCAPGIGTATVFQTVCCSLTAVERLRLSDAAVLASWRRGDVQAEPLPSGDGSLLALGPRVVRLDDGSAVRTFAGGAAVLGFSRDDRFVLTGTGDPKARHTFSYVELATGRTVWTETTTALFDSTFGHPGTGDLALALANGMNQTPYVTILHSDGTAAAIDGLYKLPWGPGIG